MSALEPVVAPAAFGRTYRDWIDVTQPAAGAAASVTIQGPWYVRVIAARATLTTDSNVANRILTLDYINARSITYHQNGAAVLVTASTTNQVFDWDYRRTVAEWNTGTPVWAPLLDEWLPPGFTIKFNVASIQVGDQLASLTLWVEKLPTGTRSGPENAFPYLPR